MQSKVIGILGGLGPKATADLFGRIINATPVTNEQDHLRIIIDNNPKIPDRNLGILGKAESPLEELTNTALNLERAGVEIIAIPCNTAHYYLNDLRKSVSVPFMDMIAETGNYISKQFPEIKRLGLLATTTTIKTQLYQRKLKPRQILLPDSESQSRVMEAIYTVKGARPGFTHESARKEALTVAQSLVARGAEAIIVGCTELSTVFSGQSFSVPLIDPLQILALAVVKEAKPGSKEQISGL
ncbi:aspartate/glutamate racemase family protein [Chloroflexota bacterium]